MKWMRKAAAVLALAGVLGSLTLAKNGPPTTAEKSGSITVNHVKLEKTAVWRTGSDHSDIALVPLRAVIEAMGGKVEWDHGVVHVNTGVMKTDVTIGEDRYFVATALEDMVGMSAPFSLGYRPYLDNDVTYVPLSLIDALLGGEEGKVTIGQAGIAIETEESAQIPNPIRDFETVEEAAKAAGIVFQAPKELPGGYARVAVSTIDKLMQVQYRNEKGEGVLVRKARGTEDISGDYNDYSRIEAIAANGAKITLKGSGQGFVLAIWQKDGYAYAVESDAAMSQSEMAAIIETIC